MLVYRPQALHARGGHLVLEDIYHGPACGLDAHSVLEVDNNAFVLNSFSKHVGMTGWRPVWLIAPPDTVPELEKLAQNLCISPSTITQHTALATSRLRASPSRLNCACLHPGTE